MESQENNLFSAQKPSGDLSQLGFLDLAKASLQFLLKKWPSFLKLGFILAIPFLVLYGVLTFYFIQSALGQDSFRAHAAPAIPSQEDPSSVLPVVELPLLKEVETTPPGKSSQGSILGGLEGGAPPSIYSNPKYRTPVFEDGFKEPLSVSPKVSTPIVLIFILIIVLGLIYELMAIMAFYRLIVVIQKDEYVGALSIIKWSFKKIGSTILLTIRTMLYTFIWIPIVVLLGYTVLTFLSSLEVVFIPANVSALLNYGLGLAALISIIISIIRVPRAIFSLFVLADRECSSKEALQHSVEISIGHWWQIVFYWIGIAIITVLVSEITVTIIRKISSFAGSIVNLLLSLLIFLYTIIFFFGLYRSLESRFKSGK